MTPGFENTPKDSWTGTLRSTFAGEHASDIPQNTWLRYPEPHAAVVSYPDWLTSAVGEFAAMAYWPVENPSMLAERELS
jgi:hypothetical protein